MTGSLPKNSNYKALLTKLFALNRSLLGPENDTALELLGRYLPLRYHNFKSGTPCFDWAIPPAWHLKHARLTDMQGKVLLDAATSILHVVNYSSSFKEVVHLPELKRHLHTVPHMPHAIPYRTSYYARQWGLCLSHEEAGRLKDSRYAVDIEATFMPGVLRIGEAILPGTSKREVVLSAYLCHPQQAHDGLSGVVLLVMLYHLLKRRPRALTYRFFFIPETIGTLALLSRGVIKPSRVEYGLIATCVGAGEVITYKKTFLNNHRLDTVAEDVLRQEKQVKSVRDYWPAGSDERQYSSPGVQIPVGSLMGAVYQEYPEYHTSLDTLELVSLKKIKYFAQLYERIIRAYEAEPLLASTVKGGEPFLSKRGLYRTLSRPGHNDAERIAQWILLLADHQHTIKDVAARSGYSEKRIRPVLKKLIDAKLVNVHHW